MLKNLAFAATVFAQVATITYLYAQPAWTMAHGEVITLKTKPVDPYDMFRGEYAQLSYEFEKPTPKSLNLQPNQTVYAVLTKNPRSEDNWRVTHYSTTMPQVGSGEVVLRGRADGRWSPIYFDNSSSGPDINFGIEKLYLPEGVSRNLQTAGRTLKVEVAVSTAGQALIKRVFDGDKLIYDGTRTLGL